MKFIVEFYKGLDAVNLLIFWGVIIVVLLLLIFAIIISNKNRKLERIIEKSGIDIDNFDDDPSLAIKKDNQVTEEKEEIINNEKEHAEIDIQESNNEKIVEPTIKNTSKEPFVEFPTIASEPIKEEKFIAEEHVMEYQNDLTKTNKNDYNVEKTSIPNTPYQRNVLREISSNQTSPIGIAKNNSNYEREIRSAVELNRVLNEETKKENTIEQATLINQKRYVDTYNQNTRKGDYLEELSRKLSNANNQDGINRTQYEIKEEEDAIISYEELMRKKDSIKTIDEEDAVISIDELMKKKQEAEKIYNITKEEENDEFISELKHFRSDL